MEQLQNPMCADCPLALECAYELNTAYSQREGLIERAFANADARVKAEESVQEATGQVLFYEDSADDARRASNRLELKIKDFGLQFYEMSVRPLNLSIKAHDLAIKALRLEIDEITDACGERNRCFDADPRGYRPPFKRISEFVTDAFRKRKN